MRTFKIDQRTPVVGAAQGKIRLLVDASNFSGWENIAAFEKHIGFINNHHQKVERIVNPEVRAYDKGEESEALAWITG